MSQQLKEEIRRGFAGLEDPLAGLLDMLESNGDWKGKGHSLGYYISSELQLWMKEHPAVQQVRKGESKRSWAKGRAADFNVPQTSPLSLHSIVSCLLCGCIQTRCDKV